MIIEVKELETAIKQIYQLTCKTQIKILQHTKAKYTSVKCFKNGKKNPEDISNLREADLTSKK